METRAITSEQELVLSANADLGNPPGDLIFKTSGVERGRIKSDGTATGVLAGGGGGGGATVATVFPASNGVDDTAALNALLAAGGIFKGLPGETYLLTGPLVVFSDTVLDMSGCTVQLKSGSNSNILHNHAWVAGAGRDSNIRIVGGVWDRGDNVGAGQALHTFLLQRVDQFAITDLTVKSTAGKYAIDLYACTNGEVGRITFDYASDGVHVEGAASRLWIHDIYGTTGDDSVALTPLGGTQNGDLGDITDVRIEGVYTTSTGANGVKVLGGFDGVTHYNVRRVWIKDVIVHAFTNAIFIGGDTADARWNGGSIYDVDIDGVYNSTGGTAGTIFVQNQGAGQIIDGLAIRRAYAPVGSSVNFFQTAGGVTTVGSCVIRDSRFVSSIAISGGAEVQKLVVEGCFFDLAAGVYAVTLTGTNSKLQTLHVRDCRIDHATISGGTVQLNGVTNTVNHVFLEGVSMNQAAWIAGDFGGSITCTVHIRGLVNYGGASGLANVRAGATITFEGAAVVGNGQVNNAGTIKGNLQYNGTGAPAQGANVGDLYFRQDGGAGTTIYRCTAAGNPATWTGIL